MKAVVLGGSGFIGSHVADGLRDRGYDVRVFDIRPSPYLKAGQKMIAGDILDAAAVRRAIEGCDYVYHFAGIADIDEANSRPVDTVRFNILGTANVLDACRVVGVKRFLYASTIYVYSHAGGFYRCSKQAAESYIEMYQQEYGVPYTILRYGSLYGSRADAGNAVRRYLSQAFFDGEIVCYGDGEEVREYIHVSDAARNSIEVLSPEYENQHVVLTGHQQLKVCALLEMIQEILGRDVKVVFRAPNASVHYRRTPYNFTPKLGRKLVSSYYLDMGQGLLSCLEELAAERAHQGTGEWAAFPTAVEDVT